MKTIHLKHKTHFLWMAMCFLLLVFTGCSKDEDPLTGKDAEKIAENIIGKWNLEKYVSQETPGKTETHQGKSGEWAEFKKDGTGSQRWAEDNGEFDLEPFTWKVKDGKLIFDEEDDEDDRFTIVKLTDKELVFQAEGTYSREKQTIKWVETYYLKK